MVTVKRATTKKLATIDVTKFHPEWFTDPGPEIAKILTRKAQADLAKAKKDFAKRVNEILATGRK
jgi:hypothetical protein